MDKFEPKNREEAFAHQLIDDVKLLLPLSQLSDNCVSYEKQLKIIEQRIETYRELKEKEESEKLDQKKEKWQVISPYTLKAYFTGSYVQCMKWKEECKIPDMLEMVPFSSERIIADISELLLK